MKVLVSGGCGFIGSHVVEELIKVGHTPWVVDDLSTGKTEYLPRGVELAKIDIRSWYELVSEFVDFEPDAVIHLAAQASITTSEDNPIHDGSTNIMGTLNMIRASQKKGVKKFIFASTSAVYNDAISKNLTENSCKLPKSPYAISKLAAEEYVSHLMPAEGVVLRFGNVYGDRQVPLGENQVIARMIDHCENGSEFFIHGSGNQKRDFVHVDDVARACVMALDIEKTEPLIVNIASGTSTSVNEIAKIVEEIYDVVGYVWQHTDKEDPRQRVCMDIEKAGKELGWKPSVDMKSGILNAVDWWRNK